MNFVSKKSSHERTKFQGTIQMMADFCSHDHGIHTCAELKSLHTYMFNSWLRRHKL